MHEHIRLVRIFIILFLFQGVAAELAAADATQATGRIDTGSAEYKAIQVPKDVSERAGDLMRLQPKLQQISDNIYMASGTGNAFLIKTPDGNVVFDTGVPWQGNQQKELLLSVGHDKTTHVIVSHAHGDHMGGLMAWRREFAGGTELVAHSRYRYTNRIYSDTVKYLGQERTASIYPAPKGFEDMARMLAAARLVEPGKLVNPYESYTFALGGVKFEVIAMQDTAEGEDNLILWLPEEGIVFTGDFFGPLYPMVPNLYTVRGEKVRDPLGYIEALDYLIALEPRMLIPSHFGVIEGRGYIHKSLTVMRDGTQYLYDETIKGMSEGKSVYELMDTIRLPEQLEISQGHGKVSWNVRAIWELLAGWYYFEDVADLYPVPTEEVYPDVVDLVGGQQKLVERASIHHDKGRSIEALRLLDIAKSQGYESVGGMSLRASIYQKLLTESQESHNNISLDDILGGALKAAQANLERTQ